MATRIFLILALILSSLPPTHAQTKAGVLYVVDSVIVNAQAALLNPADVAVAHAIGRPETLGFRRFHSYDSVVFIFTKSYMQRPEKVRKLLRPGQLRLYDGEYTYKQKPYTGNIIQFNFDGSVMYEGRVKRGKLVGTHYCNQPGQIPHYIVYAYRNGRKEIIKKDTAGVILERGIWRADNTPDLEEVFYPNGQVKHRLVRSARGSRLTSYSSTGVLLQGSLSDARRGRSDAREMTPGAYHDVVWERDGEIPGARYAHRANSYRLMAAEETGRLAFDKALRYIDTLIALEPLEPEYYLLRAETRLRKYVYAANNLKGNSESAFYGYISNYPELSIPAAERKQITTDLTKAKTYYFPRQYGNLLYYYVGSSTFDNSIPNYLSGNR